MQLQASAYPIYAMPGRRELQLVRENIVVKVRFEQWTPLIGDHTPETIQSEVFKGL